MLKTPAGTTMSVPLGALAYETSTASAFETEAIGASTGGSTV